MAPPETNWENSKESGDAGRVSMTCSSFCWMLTRTCGKCSGKWANLCCVSFGQLHRPRVAPKKKSRNSIVHINRARDEHAGHQTGWTRNQLFVTKHIGWMRMYLRSEWAAVGDPRVFGGHVNQATSNQAHPQPWLHHHHHHPHTHRPLRRGWSEEKEPTSHQSRNHAVGVKFKFYSETTLIVP